MTDSVKIDNLLAPLYAFEVPYIQQLQELYVQHWQIPLANSGDERLKKPYFYFRFKDQKSFLTQVSRVGDPSKAFILYFPLIFGIHRLSGIKFLGTVVLCEWSNQVLKW